MSKAFLIEVGEKPVTLGKNIYGRGGKYEVEEHVARELVSRGKAKVIKGKLPRTDPDDMSKIDNEVFLKRIKQNATAILGILSEEASRSGAPENPVETTSTEEPTEETSTETAKETEDSEDDEEDESDSDDIPESFPGREVLAKNNITKLSQIPTTKDELMQLDQMTGRVANQIGVKLSENK